MYTENTSSVLPKLLSDLTALWGTAIYIMSGFAHLRTWRRGDRGEEAGNEGLRLSPGNKEREGKCCFVLVSHYPNPFHLTIISSKQVCFTCYSNR